MLACTIARCATYSNNILDSDTIYMTAPLHGTWCTLNRQHHHTHLFY
jgi:hypothetical protein